MITDRGESAKPKQLMRPLVITLETEEEVRVMYASLNIPTATLREYNSDKLHGVDVVVLQLKMWHSFAPVYEEVMREVPS